MTTYYFDLRSNGTLSFDEEGTELPDANAAHEQAVETLAEVCRTGTLEGGPEQRFGVQVRDEIGAVLEVSAIFSSKIIRKQ